MNIDLLLKRVAYFQKLAQQDPYDSNLRNLVVNTRLNANDFSFREIAGVVLQDLTALDPNEANANITGANHAILDILNALTVPDPSSMLNAAKKAAEIIRQGYPQDVSKQKIANYFVTITQKIINKYFNSNKMAPSQPSQDEAAPSESTSKFLNHIYNILTRNQQLDESDINKWNSSKNFYVRRLNGLNSLTQLTPQQQEEKSIIKFVINNLT